MKVVGLTLAAGFLTFAAAGAAGAQGIFGDAPGVQYAPRGSLQPYGQGFYEGRSSRQIDQEDYRESGTRGRQDLGADPRHPEGPGNQTIPGFR